MQRATKDLQSDFQGSRSDGLKHNVRDRPIDGQAWQSLTHWRGRLDTVPLAKIVCSGVPVIGVIPHCHAQATHAAEDKTLQQGGAFTRRTFPSILPKAASVIQQPGLVGFELLPGDVSGMHVGKKDGPLFALQAPIAQLTSQSNLALAGPAVDECSGIARVM